MIGAYYSKTFVITGPYLLGDTVEKAAQKTVNDHYLAAFTARQVPLFPDRRIFIGPVTPLDTDEDSNLYSHLFAWVVGPCEEYIDSPWLTAPLDPKDWT